MKDNIHTAYAKLNAALDAAAARQRVTFRDRTYIGPFNLVGFGKGRWELRSDESGVILTGSRNYVIRTGLAAGFEISEK